MSKNTQRFIEYSAIIALATVVVWLTSAAVGNPNMANFPNVSVAGNLYSSNVFSSNLILQGGVPVSTYSFSSPNALALWVNSTGRSSYSPTLLEEGGSNLVMSGGVKIGMTNYLSTNGASPSGLLYNGTPIGGGGSAPAGTLTTNGASISSGDIVAYGAQLTNTSKASLANLTNAFGLSGDTTKAISGDGTLRTFGGGTVGTVVNTVAATAGVPLGLAGTNPTNAVPLYTSGKVQYITGSHTILYTDNASILRHADATNSIETFNDGATNGFEVVIKNVGTANVTLTNNAGLLFDTTLTNIVIPPKTVVAVRANGTNYITGRISPNTLTSGNTVYASPSDGSSGVPTMRSLVSADLPAGTTPVGANPTATIGNSPVNGSALTFLRSDGAPALPTTLQHYNGTDTNAILAAIGGITGAQVPSNQTNATLASLGGAPLASPVFTTSLTLTNGSSGSDLVINGNTANTWLFNANTNGVSVGGITNNGQWLFPDGTAALPSIAFASQNDGTGTGFYMPGSNQIYVSINGASDYLFNSTGFTVANGLSIQWSDAFINRDNAATIQLGSDSATPINQTFKSCDATGTDHNGASFTLQGGQSTGTGVGGALILRTSQSSTTASTANAYVNRFYLAPHAVVLTSASAILVFNVSLATNKTCGIHVFATTRADNGTDFQGATDDFTVIAVNKNGTVSVNASSSVATGNVATSGTITTLWTAVANGNGVDIKCTETSTVITPTTNIANWRADIDTNDSALAVTAQ